MKKVLCSVTVHMWYVCHVSFLNGAPCGIVFVHSACHSLVDFSLINVTNWLKNVILSKSRAAGKEHPLDTPGEPFVHFLDILKGIPEVVCENITGIIDFTVFFLHVWEINTCSIVRKRGTRSSVHPYRNNFSFKLLFYTRLQPIKMFLFIKGTTKCVVLLKNTLSSSHHKSQSTRLSIYIKNLYHHL